jgi:predicted RNase H-like nuclease
MDKQMYKQLVAEYMRSESELKEKIKELETELYFCRRNNKIEKEVNG